MGGTSLKVKALRALSRFAPIERFRLSWIDGDAAFAFVRPGRTEGLFEHVLVDGAGKHGDAVVASAGVAVVEGRTATKGLIELETIVDLPGVASRGHARIETKEEAIRWEENLARVAPQHVAALADRKGAALLEATAVVREVTAKYAVFLPAGLDATALRRWLEEQIRPQERAEAQRLAGWPGVLRFEGGEQLYGIASLALVAFAERVEKRQAPFQSTDPLEDQALMWRIQVLADTILRMRLRPAVTLE